MLNKKKSYPLSFLIAFKTLAILVITVIPMIYMLYLNFEQNLDRNIKNYFEQTKNIASILIENRVKNLKILTNKFSTSHRIQNSHELLDSDIFDEIKDASYDNVDIVILEKDGKFQDFSSSLFDTQKITSHLSLIENLESYNFLNFKMKDRVYGLLLESQSIIDVTTNRVKAIVYIGQFLNDNLELLNELKVHSNLQQIFFASNGHIIANLQKDSNMLESAKSMINEPDDELDIKSSLITSKMQIENDSMFGLFEIIGSVDNDSFVNLQSSFTAKIIYILLFILIIIVSSAIFTNFAITKPLEKLVRQAFSITTNENQKNECFRIKEFQLLALQINEMITNLNDTKNRLQLAIEGANDGLWDWNVKTGETYFSPRWKEMIGYKNDEIINDVKEWDSRMHPDDKEKTYKDLQNYFDKKTSIYENIHRIRHKNGSWVWILDRGKALFDKEEKPIRMVGFHTDITKQKEQEDNLKEMINQKIMELRSKDDMLSGQAKLAAMGEMIGAIAHQWRQPLNALAINIQNLEDDFADGAIDKDFLRSFIKNQVQTIQFMSKTIDDFRDFYKIDKERQLFYISEVIGETIYILQAQLNRLGIKVETTIVPDFSINGFKGEFQQVILNIISNMKDVIIERNVNNGLIKIETEVTANRGFIYIKDNAGGIDKKIIDRIFEPYFTTKEQGKGTGLGLYMSKMIIERNLGGYLRAINDDNGALFTIELEIFYG